MSGYISEKIRRTVAERALSVCEYCRIPQINPILKHHIEHISPRKHGGETTLENLALACAACNRSKGSDVGTFDLKTNLFTPFFNPRTQVWTEHFQVLESGKIKPLTAEASITVKILRINDAELIDERRQLMKAGFYE